MLAIGIIQESNSRWSSPTVLVKKKDGTTRFCIDYRRLNQVTKIDAYPLPHIEDSLNTLGGARFFCSLDLASGYWQVEMDAADRERTAFVTQGGLYEFRVMPFGLVNAPATFERPMERILRGIAWSECLAYLDEILVIGPDFETTLARLESVLDRLGAAGLKLKAKKCQLFQEEIPFLGHIVSAAGIGADPVKCQQVRDWRRSPETGHHVPAPARPEARECRRPLPVPVPTVRRRQESEMRAGGDSPIMRWKRAGNDRPRSEDISPESREAKVLWCQWE